VHLAIHADDRQREGARDEQQRVAGCDRVQHEQQGSEKQREAAQQQRDEDRQWTAFPERRFLIAADGIRSRGLAGASRQPETDLEESRRRLMCSVHTRSARMSEREREREGERTLDHRYSLIVPQNVWHPASDAGFRIERSDAKRSAPN